jgi:hypothetical protein
MNNFLGTLTIALITTLLVGCDGSNLNDALAGDAGDAAKTDSGSATQTGTCPVPGPDKTATPVHPGQPLTYLVSNGPVTCTDPMFSQPPYKGIPCSDLAGNLETPAYTACPDGSGGVSCLCCVTIRKDTTDSRVTPTGLACGDSFSDVPGEFGKGQTALCSSSGSFLGWICPAYSPGT